MQRGSEFGSDIGRLGADGTGHSDGRGDVLLAISNALVRLYKECYGKGPTKARTYHHGDVITCVLRGGFTRAEQTLLENGHADAVHEQRRYLQQAAKSKFVGAVEAITGRRVVAFISGTEHDPDVHAEVFVLASQDPAPVAS
jgi:uncharacterized protein YbcI